MKKTADMSVGVPRVVFDCNVYLQSAASGGGPAFACLELAESGAITLLASAGILREVRAVLSRPIVRKKFTALTDELVSALMGRLLQMVEIIPDPPLLFPFPRDPKDEPYINLAIAGKARYLVSRDKDLLSLGDDTQEDSRVFRSRYPEITVLDPVAFLRMMRDHDSAD